MERKQAKEIRGRRATGIHAKEVRIKYYAKSLLKKKDTYRVLMLVIGLSLFLLPGVYLGLLMDVTESGTWKQIDVYGGTSAETAGQVIKLDTSLPLQVTPQVTIFFYGKEGDGYSKVPIIGRQVGVVCKRNPISQGQAINFYFINYEHMLDYSQNYLDTQVATLNAIGEKVTFNVTDEIQKKSVITNQPYGTVKRGDYFIIESQGVMTAIPPYTKLKAYGKQTVWDAKPSIISVSPNMTTSKTNQEVLFTAMVKPNDTDSLDYTLSATRQGSSADVVSPKVGYFSPTNDINKIWTESIPISFPKEGIWEVVLKVRDKIAANDVEYKIMFSVEAGGAEPKCAIRYILKEDSFSVSEGSPRVVLDVLENDTNALDVNNKPTNIIIYQNVPDATDKADIQCGYSVEKGRYVLYYEPYTNAKGIDRFYYAVTDSCGFTGNKCPVIITLGGNGPLPDPVVPIVPELDCRVIPCDSGYHCLDGTCVLDNVGTNKAPNAEDDGFGVPTNAGAAVKLNVLANDSDPDSNIITIKSATQPSFGVITYDSGFVYYKPKQDYKGEDTFTYEITDTMLTDTATVRVKVDTNSGPIDPDPEPKIPNLLESLRKQLAEYGIILTESQILMSGFGLVIAILAIFMIALSKKRA